MRLLLKLMLLAVLGGVMQVGFESAAVVHDFQIDLAGGGFTDQAAQAYHDAQRNYQHANGVTKWLVATVFFDPGTDETATGRL